MTPSGPDSVLIITSEDDSASFTITQRGVTAYVYPDGGDLHVASFPIRVWHKLEEALEKRDLIQLMLSFERVRERGYLEGRRDGGKLAQANIRRALGITQ